MEACTTCGKIAHEHWCDSEEASPDTLAEETVRGYLACAVWAECDAEGGDLSKRYDVDAFSQEAVQRAHKDVAAFLASASEDIDALVMSHSLTDETFSGFGAGEDIGHCLWLSRNGHGSGFFDKDWPEVISDAMQEKAEALGSCDVYEGDDGKLHFG